MMKGIKFKPLQAGRKALLLGGVIAVAGAASLLAGGVANAAIGNGLGQITFSSMSGALTSTPTWSTSVACPSGFAFGTLQIVAADNTTATPDIPTIGATTVSATSPISGAALEANIATIESSALYTSGQTAEIVVQCSTLSGDTGTRQYFQDAWLTFNTDGTTYTLSDTAPAGPVTPNVTLAAQPTTVQIGSSVTLTATVTATTGTQPAGAVQFESNGTAIGTPVTLSSSGVATTSTTFTSAGSDSLTAVYQSSNTTLWANNTSPTVSETVTSTNPLQGSELITVSVGATGAFTFTPPTNATVPLTVSGSTATGTLVPVSVSDTRNTYPGWSVVGQSTNFSNPTSNPVGSISAANFNWTPTTTTPGDFTLGGASTTGLGTAQTLASAAVGHGNSGTSSFSLGAGLSLAIPPSAPAGAYSSTLTITANPSAP